MIELATLDEGERASSRTLARKTIVPKSFLHKLAGELVKAGLIHTFAGPKGGLSLARPASEITTLDIVEAMEGPVIFNMCLLRPQECPLDLLCAGHRFWGRIQTNVQTELAGTTLAMLVQEAAELKKNPQSREGVPYIEVGAAK